MSPCCPQLDLHHLFLSLPWKKVWGQASFRGTGLAKGLTVGTSQEEQSQTRQGVLCFLGTCRVSKPCSGTLFLPEALQVARQGTDKMRQGNNLIPSRSQETASVRNHHCRVPNVRELSSSPSLLRGPLEMLSPRPMT